MLNGYDISHHQQSGFVRSHGDADFFIIKATEGKTYTDPLFTSHISDAINEKKLIGAYHFARPENRPTMNGAREEARNFVNAVKPYIGRCLFALDWEMKAWNYSLEWALTWLETVYTLTGVRPVMYCHINKTALKDVQKIADANFGLWVVYWGKNTGADIELPKDRIKSWKTWTLWQWTSKPYDRDKFNGTKEQWLKYCTVNSGEKKDEKTDAGDGFCGCELCELLKEAGYVKN